MYAGRRTGKLSVIRLSFLAAFIAALLTGVAQARDATVIETDIAAKEAANQKLISRLTSAKEAVIRLEGDVARQETTVAKDKNDMATALENIARLDKVYAKGSKELEQALAEERASYEGKKAAHEKSRDTLAGLMEELKKARHEEVAAQTAHDGNKSQLIALKKELAEAKYTAIKNKIEKEQVLEVTGEVSCGKATIAECKTMALEQAKRNAAEQGSAVLVDSMTEIQDFQLTEDVIKTRVRAMVMSHEILDKGFVGDSGYFYKIRAVVKGQVPPDMKEKLFGEAEEAEREMQRQQDSRLQQPTARDTAKGSGQFFVPRKEEEAQQRDEVFLEAWLNKEVALDENSHQAGEMNREPVLGMEFVWVPGGSYNMGCGEWTSNCQDDEAPVHEVAVDGFWMAKYEVTEGQWQQIMGKVSYAGKGGNYPITWISWYHVQEFIKRLNARSSQVYEYRLPSEAEWEYACRSGGREEMYSGSNKLEMVSWVTKGLQIKNLFNEQSGSPRSVGSMEPNALGIYDMNGNVSEWTVDVYNPQGYALHNAKNPVVERGFSKDLVVRGGNFGSDPAELRCSARDHKNPGRKQYNGIGFRLVRVRKDR